MRTTVAVLLALVIALITLVGVYTAFSTVLDSGEDETESIGESLTTCLGEAFAREEGECDLFSSDNGGEGG